MRAEKTKMGPLGRFAIAVGDRLVGSRGDAATFCWGGCFARMVPLWAMIGGRRCAIELTPTSQITAKSQARGRPGTRIDNESCRSKYDDGQMSESSSTGIPGRCYSNFQRLRFVAGPKVLAGHIIAGQPSLLFRKHP